MIPIYTLGRDCQLVNVLARLKFNCKKSIFYGLVASTIQGVIKVLESDGKHFFSLENLIQQKFSFDRVHLSIEDCVTNVRSVHEFKPELSIEENFEWFRTHQVPAAKIGRFFETLKTSEETMRFIRINTPRETLEDVIQLHDAIKTLRGGRPFEMYCFQDAAFMDKNWGLPNLWTFRCEPWKWDRHAGWIGYPHVFDSFIKLLCHNSGVSTWSIDVRKIPIL